MTGLTIPEAWAAAAARCPSKVAIYHEGQELTYGQIDEDSRRLAAALNRGLQIRLGERVGVMMHNRPEFIIGTLAIARAGLALVPIPAGSTERELNHFIADSGLRGLLIEDSIASRIEDGLGQLQRGGVHVIPWNGGFDGAIAARDLIRSAASDAVEPVIDEDTPFFFGYTSGTTGLPKAAVISHRARTALMLMMGQEYGCYTGADCHLISTPLYHGAGLTRGLAPLMGGGSIVLLTRFDAERAVQELGSSRVTATFMVPTMFASIFDLPESVLHASRAGSPRAILSNASALPEHLKVRILDQWPDAGLFEIYGSTEAGTVTTLRPEDQRRKERCVGPPLALTTVRLLDDAGVPVATGEIGELHSRSPFTFSEYFGNPEATRRAMRDGFVSVGDLARFDDEGYVYIVGRKSDVIITGGVNVYPREVEEVLATHSAVREVAVIGIPDEHWGERVHAVIVANPGAAVSEADLLAHARVTLSPQKVPRSVEFRDALPKTATGKAITRQLKS